MPSVLYAFCPHILCWRGIIRIFSDSWVPLTKGKLTHLTGSKIKYKNFTYMFTYTHVHIRTHAYTHSYLWHYLTLGL